MTNQEHCDAMYDWLVQQKINSHRHDIIKAVAEKTEHLYPSKKNQGSEGVRAQEETDLNYGGIFFLLVTIAAMIYASRYL